LSKGFFIVTMGCQMNEYDSEYLRGRLIELGYKPVDVPEKAAVVLINTCTVREKADQKAFSLLGRLSRIKLRQSEMILGLAGCLAQKEGKRLFKRFPRLDFVIGPRELGNIGTVLDDVSTSRKKRAAIGLDHPPLTSSVRFPQKQKISAFISIMQGCNNFCAYCIVPYVRGREISRSPGDIVAEARQLIANGTREITLIGQNVNSYLWNDGKNFDFSALLHELNGLEGLLRLRFTTSHPKDLSDDLIHCFGKLDKLCPHIHLPFQAGANDVLRRMKRGYTREHYMSLADKLREAAPGIAITSDVMVGFPGESREDFEETLDLVEKTQFDSLFSFKYSDREGTLASRMKNKVGEQEKANRLSVLQDVQKAITLKKNRSLENRELMVLIEGYSKKDTQLMGRTGSNKIVNLRIDAKYIGRLVNVHIQRGYLHSLLGNPLNVDPY
jgi:tRNA-2-methylthio-N6-dimethylallyladenosine synthase